MTFKSRLIEKYIFKAVFPYLLLSLLLLTAILFTQQASRFGELLMGTQVPFKLIEQLALLVLPNVLIFTLPMAILTGVLIGYSRMGSDSELIALRASGVGTWKMLWPPLLMGVLLTAASLFVNLNLTPDASRSLRRIGISAALYKLESPVEPRSFNTDIPGLVIYVRDGYKERGVWGRVFLYREEKDNSITLVTARTGRIDSAGDQSELVLTDVARIILPNKGQEQQSYITERLDTLRIILDTGRKAILEAQHKEDADPKPNEMNWQTLAEYAASKTGPAGLEAKTLLHKRLAMSITPLLFAFLGATLGIRVKRGGRGTGILLSILFMLGYYLLTLAGEQLARAGTVAPFLGAWLASGATAALGFLLLATGNGNLFQKAGVFWERVGYKRREKIRAQRKQRIGKVRLLTFPSLMDLNLLRATALSFALAFISLILIYQIFTLFELWRFIISKGISVRTVVEYLIFLLPMVSVQLLPASVLIAMLATYAIISRRSEAIAWWASGQSVYRLMLPGMLFALTIATSLWLLEEHVMPQANIRQDELRNQIRGGAVTTAKNSDRQWLASSESNRLYSYQYEETGELKNPVIYDFDQEGIHLREIIRAQAASRINRSELSIQSAEFLDFKTNKVGRVQLPQAQIQDREQPDAFNPSADKPSHLSSKALSNYIKRSKMRGIDATGAAVALQKKYADPFGVLVLALVSMPLALSYGRRSAIIALCLAIFLGLVFWAATSGFQQLGEHELLPPIVAAWSPIAIFAMIGTYLLSRMRT
jgi:LPS export ABC transporter permease LptF/LPS export ABC transporter permease LptG